MANHPTLETLEERQVARHLNDLESRLVSEYGRRPGWTDDRVVDTVRVVRGRFADARIHAFLPILVERAARKELDQ
ncbi:hypothetical protein GCM10023321_59050 [Pseudonocardia eucalypti]|uniref:DUF3562 domain-containing protein n=1 Tax=Pseudonocardia eucalypti TaxID=648755 RepID=A0ABP9QSY2_9PSEU|nr:hypothetical protein [Pseudonocardia eucalypti]